MKLAESLLYQWEGITQSVHFHISILNHDAIPNERKFGAVGPVVVRDEYLPDKRARIIIRKNKV